MAIKALYFFTGLGHEAVVVFFVISGYLVGGLSLQKWRTKGVNLGTYAVARVSRIYTVLIPGLLLGATLDWIGWHFFNHSALYTAAAQYGSSMNTTVSENLGLSTFLGNLLMLQGISVPRLGSNAPLWSLANEWWYYTAFALLAGGLLAPSRGRKAALLVLLLLLTVLLPPRLMLWVCVWCLGVAAAEWIERGRRFPPFWLGALLFGGALIASRLSHNVETAADEAGVFSGFGRDLLFGLAYTLLLVCAATGLRRAPSFSRLHHRLADFSYSTYVIHFPVMLLMVAVAFSFGLVGVQVQPTTFNLTFLFVWIALVYVCCYGFFWLFERHTDKIRRGLGSLLLGQPKAPARP